MEQETTNPETIQADVRSALRPLIAGLLVFDQDPSERNPFHDRNGLTDEGILYLDGQLRGWAESAQDVMREYAYGDKEPRGAPRWIDDFVCDLHRTVSVSRRAIEGIIENDVGQGGWSDLRYLCDLLRPPYQDICEDPEGRWQKAVADWLGRDKTEARIEPRVQAALSEEQLAAIEEEVRHRRLQAEGERIATPAEN